MTYKTTVSSSSICTATITRKKNRVKSYTEDPLLPQSFFLKDGEEFEIELFNPLKTRVLAKIEINGSPLSDSGIVLMPGQRIFLERYLDSNKKFVFETYQVEKSDAVKEAITNNGNIRVSFYEEKIKTNGINGCGTTINNITYKYNYPYCGGFYYDPSTNPLYYSGTPNISIGTGTIPTHNFNTIPSSIISGTTLNNNSNSSSSFNSYPGGSCLSNTFSSGLNTDIPKESDNIDTGMIVGGKQSDQCFKTVYGEFNAYYSNIVLMKIEPESNKPKEISELRNYCPGCRTRIKKSSWKFCPSCGETL